MTRDSINPSHFQLYALDGRSDIRWRLLAANNRELGRGYSAHVSVEACVAAIAEMVAVLDDLVARVRRRNGDSWQWTLDCGNESIVVGSQAYDRQIRSEQAATRFRMQASAAPIRIAVIDTGARRRFRTSISDLALLRR
jgi:uncharacterized protein YegP (UPF0339 family)